MNTKLPEKIDYRYRAHIRNSIHVGTLQSRWGEDHLNWVAEEIGKELNENKALCVSYPIKVEILSIEGESLGGYSVNRLPAVRFCAIEVLA